MTWTSDSAVGSDGYECALPVSTRTVEMLLEANKEAAVRASGHITQHTVLVSPTHSAILPFTLSYFLRYNYGTGSPDVGRGDDGMCWLHRR